jgi:hypothetical protein
MKRGLKILAFVLSLLLMVLIARTLRVRPAVKAPPVAPLPIDELAAARRFAGALSIPTISHADREKSDPKQFEAMHAGAAERLPVLVGKLDGRRRGQAFPEAVSLARMKPRRWMIRPRR